MKKFIEFLKNNKTAANWTIFYIVVVYLVLFSLFDFNLISTSDWNSLLNGYNKGFAGFVLVILLFAAIPLYFATTTIITQTKKPIFNLFEKKENSEKKSDDTDEKESDKIEILKPLPENIPTELIGAFLRARQNIGLRNQSAFEMQDIQVPNIPKQESVSVALPLPTEFDNEIPAPQSFETINIGDGILPIPDNFNEITTSQFPVFKEITFGEISEKNNSGMENSELVKHLKSKGFETSYDDEIIISNNMAIVTHNDSDFWIADNENWFASGKQKKSPVLTVLESAKKHNVSPVIYLAEKNIMDIDSFIQKCESDGVKVITDLNDL